MRQRHAFWFAFVTVLFCAGLAAQAWGQGPEVKPQYYVVKNFKLNSGQVLPEMKIEYATLGTPKKDAAGNITNAVVWCHGWSGSYIQGPTYYKKVFGPGNPMDPTKYFIILTSALGSPGSSSPSTSGLGAKFPKYTVADMIKAQYLLVTKHLGIKHLAGVAGGSMGGSQTLQWITQYPDFMDWAIPIATGVATTGRNVGRMGLMNEAVKSDPAYMDGNYKQQPAEGLRRAFVGQYLWYFAPAYYQVKFKTPAEVMKGLENAGMGSEKMDANDIIWRNEAMMRFSVAANLPKVKAKTLVVGVDGDQLYPPTAEIIPIVMAIPGAKVFIFPSILGHVANFQEIDKANPAMLQFLSEAEKK